MISPGAIVRRAREAAGLSQAELADRMGTTQSAVARLESPRSNPRVETLDRAVASTGQRVTVSLEPGFGLDESLIASALRIEPRDRLRRFAAAYASARKLSEAGRRSFGP
ncbi:MAG: helix-turn-helix domain-containing protein [Solirubrobacterales bacterium]